MKRYFLSLRVFLLFFTFLQSCRGEENAILIDSFMKIPLVQAADSSSWDSLPLEIVYNIVDYCDPRYFLNFSQVDSKMYSVLDLYKGCSYRIEGKLRDLRKCRAEIKLLQSPVFIPLIKQEEKKEIDNLADQLKNLEETQEKHFKNSYKQDSNYIIKRRNTEIKAEGALEFYKKLLFVLEKTSLVIGKWGEEIQKFYLKQGEEISVLDIKRQAENVFKIEPLLKQMEILAGQEKKIGKGDKYINHRYKNFKEMVKIAGENLNFFSNYPGEITNLVTAEGKVNFLKQMNRIAEDKYPSSFYHGEEPLSLQPVYVKYLSSVEKVRISLEMSERELQISGQFATNQ